jgi:hypothetical protein
VQLHTLLKLKGLSDVPAAAKKRIKQEMIKSLCFPNTSSINVVIHCQKIKEGPMHMNPNT